VTLHEIVRDQDLRTKIIDLKETCERSKNPSDNSIEFKGIHFRIDIVRGTQKQGMVTGYILTVWIDKKSREVESSHNNSFLGGEFVKGEIEGNFFKILFNKDAKIDENLDELLKLLYKVYGLTSKQIKRMLKSTRPRKIVILKIYLDEGS